MKTRALVFPKSFAQGLCLDGKLRRCIKQQRDREKQIDNAHDGEEGLKIMRLRCITVLLSVLYVLA